MPTVLRPELARRYPARGLSGEETVQYVRERYGPATTVAFSTGKDSIGAWLAVREKFERAVCYYMVCVPGLEFVEESLDYFERYHMDEPIVRLPHPTFYRMLANYTFQTPERVPTIRASLEACDYVNEDTQLMVIDDKGLPRHTFDASGVRAADSPMRRSAIKHWGSVTPESYKYYPIWDWNKARLMDEINRAGIRLPVDYELFGRSFDGLDARFLLPIKRRFPRDYATILEWFPLAEAEVFRLERYGGIKA